ncbi:MAG TPA: hypothetical protein VMU81_24600 [Acetobacteraceae bacterium]|nr:hypothetical protein [Acetobacteraceae bacterium]
MPEPRSCCDIPPPCWMPRSAGEATCRLAAGDKGELRLLITNGDHVSHTYQLQAEGSGAADVTFSASAFTLAAKQRQLVTATFTMPAGSPPGNEYDLVIWVRGCRDHYLRWTLHLAAKSYRCCYEACIDDAPDYIVHWYDHFYCQRPCPNANRVGAQP